MNRMRAQSLAAVEQRIEKVLSRFNSAPKLLQEIDDILKDAGPEAAAPDETPNAYSKLTDAQKKKYDEAFRTSFTSPIAKEHMKQTAAEASQACISIDRVFETLASKLRTLEFNDASETLLEIREDYRKVLRKSRDLAVKIASYGEMFQDLVLPVCLDEAIHKDKKIEKLNDFVKQSEKFRKQSKCIEDELHAIGNCMNSLNNTLSSYKVESEAEKERQIKKLEREISQLEDEIKDLGSGSIFGITSAIATAGICYFWALGMGPWLVFGGLLAAGVGVSVYRDYQKKLAALSSAKVAKQEAKSELYAEVSAITQSRAELVELGDSALKKVVRSIASLKHVWLWAANDALAIKTKLSQGTEFVEFPTHLMTPIGSACGIYSQLAVYLRCYADGIEISVV